MMMANKNPNSKRSEKARRKKARRRAAQEERNRLLAMGQQSPSVRPMSHDEHQEYVRSEEWASVRDRYLASKLPKACVICDKLWHDAFHLHHRTYKRLGHEKLSDVVPVCDVCHEAVHRLQQTQGLHLWAASKRRNVLKFIEEEREAKLAQQPDWMRDARRWRHDGNDQEEADRPPDGTAAAAHPAGRPSAQGGEMRHHDGGEAGPGIPAPEAH
jgi:hypothetical protein